MGVQVRFDGNPHSARYRVAGLSAIFGYRLRRRGTPLMTPRATALDGQSLYHSRTSRLQRS